MVMVAAEKMAVASTMSLQLLPGEPPTCQPTEGAEMFRELRAPCRGDRCAAEEGELRPGERCSVAPGDRRRLRAARVSLPTAVPRLDLADARRPAGVPTRLVTTGVPAGEAERRAGEAERRAGEAEGCTGDAFAAGVVIVEVAAEEATTGAAVTLAVARVEGTTCASEAATRGAAAAVLAAVLAAACLGGGGGSLVQRQTGHVL